MSSKFQPTTKFYEETRRIVGEKLRSGDQGIRGGGGGRLKSVNELVVFEADTQALRAPCGGTG